MKTSSVLALGFAIAGSCALRAAPDPNWLGHDRDRPQPTVVDPGTFSSQEQPGKPPSDAVVLFDGKDTSPWVAMDGSPTKWVTKDGAFVCVPGSGYARTLESFGDCQLHVEWASPTPPHGDSQGRGNSGVFFGYDQYECQVLDSYNNKTYADGSAAAIYGQYPPLVNVMRPPGQWETYDIIWTAPRFDSDGKLVSKARETVFHNGVLVQNNVELTGPTGWIGRIPYRPHPERMPIALQDHGNPVRFRNLWVRELGNPRHKEFMLPDALLDSYVGDYGQAHWNKVRIKRLPDGLLSLTLADRELVMHAESMTRFFALTTDVQCEFDVSGTPKKLAVSVGDDDSKAMRLELEPPNPAPDESQRAPSAAKDDSFAASHIAAVSVSPKWTAYGTYLHNLMEVVQARWERIRSDSHTTAPSGSSVTITFSLDLHGKVSEIIDVRTDSSESGKQSCLTALTVAGPYGDWTGDMTAALGTSQALTFRFDYP